MTTDDELLDLHAEVSRTLVESVNAQTEYGKLFDRLGVGVQPVAFVEQLERLRARMAEKQRAKNEAQVRYDEAVASRR
jgi:hypothetical protein